MCPVDTNIFSEPRTSRCTNWVLKRQRNKRSNYQHLLNHGEINRVTENIYFCFINYAKASDCMDHNKLWKILKEMGVPDLLTCLLRNLCVGQEASIRTGHGITDQFRTGNGVQQGCILLPWLFNLDAECIMQNTRLDESQAGIKFSGRNIKNLRYIDNATLVAESEEDLKNFLMRVKEESEKTGLKLSIKKLSS